MYFLWTRGKKRFQNYTRTLTDALKNDATDIAQIKAEGGVSDFQALLKHKAC